MYEHDGGHELMWIEGSGSRRPSAEAACPSWQSYGSIFINEELLAADLPLRRHLGFLPPKADFSPLKWGGRRGGH